MFWYFTKNKTLIFSRNNIIQEDTDIIKLIHKMVYDLNFNTLPYKNLNGSLRLYSYIPLYLFVKRRYNFYNILENQIQFSVVYFYIYSIKARNAYKTNIFTIYSKNLNFISRLHF